MLRELPARSSLMLLTTIRDSETPHEVVLRTANRLMARLLEEAIASCSSRHAQCAPWMAESWLAYGPSRYDTALRRGAMASPCCTSSGPWNRLARTESSTSFHAVDALIPILGASLPSRCRTRMTSRPPRFCWSRLTSVTSHSVCTAVQRLLGIGVLLAQMRLVILASSTSAASRIRGQFNGTVRRSSAAMGSRGLSHVFFMCK